jgi:hypothetical protein
LKYYDSKNNLIATITPEIRTPEVQISYNSVEHEELINMVTLAIFADELTTSRIADLNANID